jgi:L-threonylcarbamoyladenylate synthase
MKKIDFKKAGKKEIDLIIEYLKKDKVIIYPTDTIYGLGCLANNTQGIKKIYRIKKRKIKKPLLVLMNNLKMVDKYCKINKEQKKILKSIWPGPVTVILEHKDKLPSILTGAKKTLAVRLPKNEFLIKIIKRIKVPLVSTSVNISGEKPINDLKKFIPLLSPPYQKGKIRRTSLAPFYAKRGNIMPDLIIDAGELRGKASAIIDATDACNIKIIRR